jgi:hypothetical protein
MPYYPKSQVQNNLYTKGGELQFASSGKEYTGYYWKTSKNQYFTGRNPSSKGALELELIPVIPTSAINTLTISKGNKVYNEAKNVDVAKALILPSYQKPSPTKEDYEIGNFVRYFAKKYNQNLYIEISKDTYKELKNKNDNYDYNSYLIFTLTWQISGDKEKTLNTNKKVTSTLEKGYRINGLSSYLNFNYLEFYIESP